MAGPVPHAPSGSAAATVTVFKTVGAGWEQSAKAGSWLLPRREVAGIILIALVISGLAALLSARKEEEETLFYVATNGNDSWSGTLRSPNRAGTDGPFSTLDRARDEVRKVIAGNLTRDVKVLIREGTYYLPSGFALGPEDSGTEEHSITYAAYPAERAYLVGGMRLTNWTAYREAIWQAPIPNNTQPLQVFENGRRMELARKPESGYFKIVGPVKGQEKTAFLYQATDFEPTGWDISDARIFIWPGYDWFSAEKPLVSIDVQSQTVTMGTASGYDMTKGNRYFIRNVLALLDDPGEAQISLSHGKVYCWPTVGPIEDQTIVISTAANVVAIKGSDEKPVRNVHLEGLLLGIANKHVVQVEQAENCSVKYCRVENGGLNGVMIVHHAQGIVVYGNLIRYNGQHGVSLTGYSPGKPDVNHHNVVENNHIHHCGRLVGHGYGVEISQSGHNKILHNEIHDMPRYGTTIKGTISTLLMQQFPNLTWEDHYDLLYSHDNLIAYNCIHDVNLDSQDTGAMESWGPGRDNVYDHNLIYNAGNGLYTLQSGMYLDDATDYFTVTNNIIYGVLGAGGDQCIFAKGVGNRFENNILIVGPTNSAAIRSMAMGGERGDTHTYLRNIIYIEGATTDVYGFINWNDTRVAESDYNLLWKPRGPLTVDGGPADGAWQNWLNLFNKTYDQHSVVADPVFVDSANGNFHLRPESPALKLGFKDIDTSEIGLKEKLPFYLQEGMDELYTIPPRLIWQGNASKQ